MFVLTEKGQLFAFRIDITKTTLEERLFAPQKPQFTGELFLDKPIVVKDMPPLKMIACGKSHLLGLEKNGKVWAMGDDTFG
jgi:alpha-tubulin suppressor-like RCC1 family protein